MTRKPAACCDTRTGPSTNKSFNGNAVATGLSIADDYDQLLIASIDNLMPAAEVENSCKNSCCYFGSPAAGNNECALGDGAMICMSTLINKSTLIKKSTSTNIDLTLRYPR